mgnify:CR=1 FL=1
MKKLFFLNTSKVFGGGEKWTLEAADALLQRGYSVTIGSLKNTKLSEDALNLKIPVKYIALQNSFSALNPFKLKNFITFLKRTSIDVLFLNQSLDLKFGGLAGHLAGVPQIIYRRGSAIPIKNTLYSRYLLKKCTTGLIANSNATKSTILKNTSHYLEHSKIKVIYNGVKVEEIEEKSQNGINIYKEFGIPEHKVILINIGRLHEQKGHTFLVDAANLLIKERDDFVILIVGDGPLKNSVQDQVTRYGLQNNFVFTGFRDEVYSLLSSSDFLVHTARWEGFGYVIAEAMALSKPVVATNVSNISEIVVNEETGLLAEPNNPNDIAEKINLLLKNPHRELMGKAGRKRVENKFTFQRMIDEIETGFLKE